MSTLILPLLLLFALFLSFATSQSTTCDQELVICDDAINRFPEDKQIQIKHANKTITKVEYFNNFVDVDIRSDTGGFKYRFVVCGCSVEDASGRQVIFINPLSLYIEDGPVLALYDFLAGEKLGLIKAVRRRELIFNSDIRDHISNGGAVEVQNENFEIEYSKIKEQDPALSMIGVFELEEYRAAELDIPYLVVAEAQERNPLARAEWMKLVGLVLDRSDKANKQFEDIEKRYNEAIEKASKAERRPAVFFNRPFGTNNRGLSVDERYNWTQPVTDEYIVQFMRDANADYRYIDEEPTAGETGGNFNISTVVRDFKSADYLLQSSYFPGSNSRTLENYLDEMVSATDPDPDARKQLEELKAVQCANVWNTQKRVTADGKADDFFESAIFRPDDLLEDFIQALHPYLDFEDREPLYIYRYNETTNAPKDCNFTVLDRPAPKDKAFVDTKFAVPDRDRYQIADILSDKVIPAIRKRIDEPFEVFFHQEDVSANVTVVTVRVQVNGTEQDSFEKTPSVVFGMREALGDKVRQRNDNGTLQDPPPESLDPANAQSEPEGTGNTAKEEGGGLSGGAIAGIVIAVIAVLFILAVLYFRRARARRRVGAAAPLSSEQNWADPDTAGARDAPRSPFL